MENKQRTFVFQIPVDLLDSYPQWLLNNRIQANLGTHVVTLNAEMAMLATRNPQLAEIIDNSELVIPDGAGVIIYLALRGYQQQRCPGIELASSLISSWGEMSYPNKIAFYGGQPGVSTKAAQMWTNKYPQLNIITNHGYLEPESLAQWQATLKAEQPKLILVGLGVPRQEFWIQANRHLCPSATWIGIGGSFDIWAGNKERAPIWLRENNLEWLYRLYQEPWRWRRMLVLPQFLLKALLFSKDKI